jgi:SAM-dependent methyltransferase
MTTDLAGYRNGTPERFVPGLMDGELVEVEHLARYWWAARHAAGRTVLDAGCGVAYGTAALADAGAAHVVGVDIVQPVLDAAAPGLPGNVELRCADVAALPFDDGAFDLVVCFEVIEHVEQRDAVLDELTRVTAPDGLVLVSSPNRAAYVPGNPHHVHEYLPEELRAALAQRFPHVALMRQHDAAASLILADDQLGATGAHALEPEHVAKLMRLKPDAEPYTIAVASHAPLPTIPSSVCLTSTVEVRRWVELYGDQQRILDEQRAALRELDAATTQRRALVTQLELAERRVAHLTDIEAQHRLAEDDLDNAQRALHDIQSSLSWRLTRPLRVAKRVLRGRRRA